MLGIGSLLAPAKLELCPSAHCPLPAQERTILQFGKVAKDAFTMDFSYPMTALQVGWWGGQGHWSSRSACALGLVP